MFKKYSRVYASRRNINRISLKDNKMPIKDEMRNLANRYAKELKARTDERISQMEKDDSSHFLIYRILGVTDEEGKLIDVYQNKGRFLYKYAGSFLEEAAKMCFKHKYPKSGSVRIPNSEGRRPKTFEIDCVVEDKEAIEIKWRDATTDGDHISKEHTRLKAVSNAGFTPIRVMFYYPNRDQAIKIQKTVETLYLGSNGKYYYGDAAWNYIHEKTDIDLKRMIEELANEKVNGNER